MLRDERGQALAEFALVMPILGLLTFGVIEMTLYLQQQSNLNAAAFMAARSSIVLGGNMTETKAALASYAQVSPGWVAGAIAGMKKSGDSYKLVAGTDRFAGLISGLTNGEVTGFDTMAAGATLPMEYVAKQNSENNAKTGPKARFLVDYHVKKTDEMLAPKAVTGAVKTIELVKKEVKDTIGKLVAMPTAKPSAPPPGKPSTGDKPNPAKTKPPIAVTTPQPNPLASPPPLGPLNALQTTGEAFSTAGAAAPNPKKHGKNDAGYTSLYYLGPRYEADERPKTDRNAAIAAKKLEDAIKAVDGDGADLNETCEAVRKYMDLANKTPGGQAIVVPFRRTMKTWTQVLTKSVDAEYKARDGFEKGHFK